MKYFCLVFTFCVSSMTAFSETIEHLKKSEDQIRQEMMTLSRQLDVTCSECHNLKNYRDDSKSHFKIALKHIKVTQILKENGFGGKNGEPEASCYMCHQGKMNYSFKEQVTDHNRQELKDSKPH